VFWTAVLVLWKFFILVAFVASKAAEICLLVYTDKALILYVVVELVLSTQLLHLPKSRLATFKKKKKKKSTIRCRYIRIIPTFITLGGVATKPERPSPPGVRLDGLISRSDSLDVHTGQKSRGSSRFSLGGVQASCLHTLVG
jgi:hypothetical protein